ncbi:MAG: response regulator [Chloroflexota bacterium]
MDEAMPKLAARRYSILIVDDNLTNLGVVSEYLKRHGFDILTARSGEAALKRVAYAMPDIILLDVMMAGINGFETCRRLKENEKTRAIPVIFMTALADDESRLKGFEAGGVDYVTKPLQQTEVLIRVMVHLQIQDLTSRLQRQNEELMLLNRELEEKNRLLFERSHSTER